jgi:diguanylate cyclase (GGDEF)-like protein
VFLGQNAKILKLNANNRLCVTAKPKVTVLVVSGEKAFVDRCYEVIADDCVSRHVETYVVSMKIEEFKNGDWKEKPIDLICIDGRRAPYQLFKIIEDIRLQQGQRHIGVVVFGDRVSFGAANALTENSAVKALEAGADEVVYEDDEQSEIAARCYAIIRLKMVTDRLRRANHKLQILSSTDELTGLNNMRFFYSDYARVMAACRDGVRDIGVIMFDLDFFKNINDQSNHLVGSYVISEVGKLVKYSGILDSSDVAARYGGDEYIIMTNDFHINQLTEKTEALRKLIASATFMKDGASYKVTASMGCAWVERGFKGGAEDLLKAADLMCYSSKTRGRNCTSAILFDHNIDLNLISPNIEQNMEPSKISRFKVVNE